MTHWFKKSAAIAMSAVMALSLAACASSKPATPEEVLQAASEKVSAAKSMTCETTTQMKMSAGGQSIQMTMTGELETTMDPVAMHMDMTTDMGAMGSMNVKMYMKEENGAYSLYTGMDDGSGNITWTAQTMENVDQLKQYDTQATMELYLSTGSRRLARRPWRARKPSAMMASLPMTPSTSCLSPRVFWISSPAWASMRRLQNPC